MRRVVIQKYQGTYKLIKVYKPIPARYYNIHTANWTDQNKNM